MLQIPDYPDDLAGKIISKHVSDRLIWIMDRYISDYKRVRIQDILNEKKPKDIDELDSLYEVLVKDYNGIEKIMFDKDFASEIAVLFPEKYNLSEMNSVFFGLYRLLKAKGMYVPTLPMEYILDRMLAIETLMSEEEDDVSGVLLFPEPQRSYLKRYFELLYTDKPGTKEAAMEAEMVLNTFEDIGEYQESCFWDRDFALLDDISEEELAKSPLNDMLGIMTPEKTVEIGAPGGMMTIKIRVYPWDTEE